MKKEEAYVSCKLNKDLRIAHLNKIKKGNKKSVEVKSPIRDLCGYITREELIKHFKGANEKEIKLHRCRNGALVIIGNDNRMYKALYIGEGTYRVVEAGLEETLSDIDQDPRISYVSRDIFNKMFTVQDRLVSTKLRASFPKFFEKIERKKDGTIQKAAKGMERRTKNKELVGAMLNEEDAVKKKGNKSWSYPKEIRTKEKYRLVFRLVDPTGRITIGYIVEELSTGKKSKMHINDVKILASEGEIERVIVEKEQLRGVGFSLNDLTIMEV